MKNFNYLKEPKPIIAKLDDTNLIKAIYDSKVTIKPQTFDDSGIIQAIKENKTVVKQEKVELKVEKVDLKPLIARFHAFESAFHSIQYPTQFEATNLPLGEGNKVGTDPTKYVIVRLTDGKNFYRATDKIPMGGGGGVSSSIGRNVVTGQTLVQSNNVAVPLSTDTMIMNGIIVRALGGNSTDVYIGNSSVTSLTGFVLSPGESTSLAINNLAFAFITGAAGDGVAYISTQ